MTRVAIVILATLLGACQPAPLQSGDASLRGGTLGRLTPFSLPLPFPQGTQLSPGMASFHCDGQSHDSGKGYPKCNVGIPVLVLDAGLDANTRLPLCVALLPYNEIIVHTGKKNNGKPKEAKIVWEIVGSSEYEFSSGIALRPQPGSPDQPSVVYDDNGTDGSNKRRYKWRAKDEAVTGRRFSHDAVVQHKSGSPTCLPMDPVIVNQDN